MLPIYVVVGSLLSPWSSSVQVEDHVADQLWTEITQAYQAAESYRGISTVMANRTDDEDSGTLFIDRFRVAVDRPTRRVGIFNSFDFMIEDLDLTISWGDIDAVLVETTLDNRMSFAQIRDIGDQVFREVTVLHPFVDLSLLLDGDVEDILPNATRSVPEVNDPVVAGLISTLESMVPDAGLAIGTSADVLRVSSDDVVLTMLVERESRMIRVANYEIEMGSMFLAPKFRMPFPIELTMITSVYPEQPGWDAVFEVDAFDPVKVSTLEAMADTVYGIHLKRIAEDIELYESGLIGLQARIDAAEAAPEPDARLIDVLRANLVRATKHVNDARDRMSPDEDD